MELGSMGVALLMVGVACWPGPTVPIGFCRLVLGELSRAGGAEHKREMWPDQDNLRNHRLPTHLKQIWKIKRHGVADCVRLPLLLLGDV